MCAMERPQEPIGASEDANTVAELASEAVAPIEQELRHRLQAEVGEQDLLAIESALLKAFLNGMGTGAAEQAEAAIDQVVPREGFAGQGLAPAVPPDQAQLPQLDPWAERYGGER
jgi:hypothetical protein